MKRLLLISFVCFLTALTACLLPKINVFAQDSFALLQGFDRSEWQHSRPSVACNYIKQRFQKATKLEVLRTLGKPNDDHEAGEGMWGHYDAYYSYTLDHVQGVDQCGYTWKTLDLSFSPSGTVSNIEVKSHCY